MSFDRLTYRWFVGIACCELLSAAVVFHSSWNAVCAIVLGLIMIALTFKQPAVALGVLMVEYILGSKGGLFRFGADTQNNGGFSIRMIFFAAFLIGWFVWAMYHKTWRDWKSYIKGRGIYFVLAAVLFYGFGLGFLRGNDPGNIINDANGWGLWLLILPVLDVVSHVQDECKKQILPALIAGLFWIAIQTIALFYLFGHGFSWTTLEPVYLWIRRTGVGEITRIDGDTYRIFFQSQIYALFVIIALWIKNVLGTPLKRWEWSLLILCLSEILISLSRSFWIGLFVGMVCLGVWIGYTKRDKLWPLIRTMGTSCLLAFALTALILFIPIPPNHSSLTNLLEKRTNIEEAAVVSRWQLLPALLQKIKQHPILGSGFGATVTYESKDPRMVQLMGGVDTTYTFEWGWLEHWVKFGIIGIPLILALLWHSIDELRAFAKSDWFALASIVSLIVLATVHFFTPYLNHPLGFAYLMGLEAWVIYKKPHSFSTV